MLLREQQDLYTGGQRNTKRMRAGICAELLSKRTALTKELYANEKFISKQDGNATTTDVQLHSGCIIMWKAAYGMGGRSNIHSRLDGINTLL